MAYIEKEPIIKFITDGLNNPDKSKAFGHDAIEILTEIEYTPTADVVEVKHGEWLVKEFSYSKFITCSVCNSVIDSSYTNIDENEFDYCPYCGAKMDGRRDT